MPKETFWNLPDEKRNAFMRAALEEFAQNNYEAASINQIVKRLGIARGSVYQYFEDKLDVWLYLKEYSEQKKMQYVQSVQRNDFASFWDYFRALYAAGVDFDLEEPLCSLFLYRIGAKENSRETAKHTDSWKRKAYDVMTPWVEAERERGAFSREIPTDILVHVLITFSLSIAELLHIKYRVDFERNIAEGKPLFGGNKDEILCAVNDLVTVMERALGA